MNLSEQYVCQKCGKTYSEQGLRSNMFCKCGAYLSKTVCVKESLLSQAKSGAPVVDGVPSNLKTRYIPEEYQKKLIESHELGSQVLKKYGCEPEPIETALVVEEHRWFWKPKEVKFILIAESHVYTGKEEVNVKIDPHKLHAFAPDFPTAAPLNFAKFVYCLGYGRPEILDHPEKIAFNPGTKQYVSLLAKCISFEGVSASNGLRWKAALLNAVKASGLWLLDASCHACAMGRKNRLPNKIVEKIVPISWKIYVEPIINDLAIDPKRVWIIGGSLQSLLRGRYSLGMNWVYQPNARFSGPNREKLQEEKRRRNLLLESTARRFLQEPNLRNQ